MCYDYSNPASSLYVSAVNTLLMHIQSVFCSLSVMAQLVAGVVRGKPGAIGLAVIVTNNYTTNENLKDLPGALIDGEAMYSALEKLNFAVYWEKNVTGDKMKQIIREMQNLEHCPVSYRCIFFVFSGHGNQDDCLMMEDTDSEPLHLEKEIIIPLLPKQANRIGLIQKVFLIDACRGGSKTSTEFVAKDGERPRQERKNSIVAKLRESHIQIPGEGGFLLAYATMPMHAAYDTLGKGGVWLSRVTRLLNDRVCLDSIENLLTKVNEVLMTELQNDQKILQPEKVSRLNKIVSLEPGKWCN